MKKAIKFLMVGLLAMGSTTLFAQKFGRIDYQTIIFTMPEIAQVQESYTKAETEYRDHLESLSVEVNKKIDEFQKLPEGTTESVKQLRQRDIVELQQRQQEYLQLAQEGMQKTQMDLMTPLQEKADAAIKKVCKAQGITVVFQTGQVVYIDEDTTVDISAAVRKELGIPEGATPSMTAPVQ